MSARVLSIAKKRSPRCLRLGIPPECSMNSARLSWIVKDEDRQPRIGLSQAHEIRVQSDRQFEVKLTVPRL
jgi:hypothetical protein